MPSHSTSFSSSRFNLTSLLEEVQITNSVHNDLNNITSINYNNNNNTNIELQQNKDHNLNSAAARMRPRSKDVVVSVVSFVWKIEYFLLNFYIYCFYY